MTTTTTIAALATAPQPAGLAVVRVSGPKTRTALRALFRSASDPVDDPRRLTFGDLIDFSSGEVIDKALAVFMPGPRSFTGEDVGEFQFHGSLLLVERVLRSLFAFGVSPAEPGEFSKRAFLNGKIDLVQAEGIAELITATSDAALRVASDHLKGRLSSAIATIGEPLRDALAELEAGLDFPDEDISPANRDDLMVRVSKASSSIEDLLSSYRYGEVLRDGFRILLCGPPNVGKSSLLNLLLGRQRAIVSPLPGTTRDLIEEQATLDGLRFVLCDSAGIRESGADIVEQQGIELARDRVSWADLVLFVVDGSVPPASYEGTLREVHRSAHRLWLVVNKIDQFPGAIGTVVCDSSVCQQNIYLSAKTGDGIGTLREALLEEARGSQGLTNEVNQVVTSERHRDCLSRAHRELSETGRALSERLPEEIAAASLRRALAALDELIGKTYTEDILGRIFGKFCIGK